MARAIPKRPLAIIDDKIRMILTTDPHAETTGMIAAAAYCRTNPVQAFMSVGDYSAIGDFNLIRAQFAIAESSGAQCHVMAIGNHDPEENTLGRGNVNLARLANDGLWGSEICYFSNTVESGDKSWSALILALDQNYHGGAATQYYQTGDRFGLFTGYTDAPETYGTFSFPQHQINWVSEQIANSDVDAVFVLCHVRPQGVMGRQSLVTAINATGKPAVFFSGHNHGHAYTEAVTNGLGASYTVYKVPGIWESEGFTVFTFSIVDGELSLDSAIINNYTDPGGWTISAPFELAA